MVAPIIRFNKQDGTKFHDMKTMSLGEIISEYTELCEKNGTYEHVSLTKEGVIPKSERYERDFLVTTEDKKYRVTHFNDICYNPANLKFGVICRNKFGDAIFSPIYVTLHVKDGFDPCYIELLVTRFAFIQRALRFQEGTVYERMAVSPEDLLTLTVAVPELEEQQKIADFLSSVDEVITASEQEVANLETQKKAVMKKIFSQEVRFKREDGTEFPDWDEQSFEKAFEPLNNNTFSRDMLNFIAGPALNIHYGDILVKYGDVCDIDKDILPFVNEGQDVAKYAFLKDGDIVLADTAEDEAVGKAIELINIHDRIVISGLHTMACRPRIAFGLKYLGYYLNSAEFHDQLKPFIQGIKVSSIGRKNISGVLVKYPSDLEEQCLIAAFLSEFDEAIAAAKKEMELWKELKKGLLQQMFV